MGQKLSRIRARTLEEAYKTMRDRYGSDAVVLSTNEVNEGGLFGLLGRRMVEITASIPTAAKSSMSEPRPPTPAEQKYASQSALPQKGPKDETVQYFEKLVRDAQRRMKQQPVPEKPMETPSGNNAMLAFPKPEAQHRHKETGLHREVQEIREMLQVLYAEAPGAGLPSEFAPHYRTLVNRGVSRKVAAALIGAVVRNSDLSIIRDGRVFVERLHVEIRKSVQVTGGIGLQGGTCRIVALCGATGVGKTTNLAKLAALFSIHERARVGLITTDTYRVAAPEQLRVYANIIGLPLKVANDAKEMRAALKEFSDYDLVLVDTAGGSQFNLEQIKELKEILKTANPHETFLVMGAGTPLDDLRNIVSNFKCLNPTSVMFTKLDETRQYGALYSMLVESGLPLGYVSVGQNVPDDIQGATPQMVANLVLEGKYNRG